MFSNYFHRFKNGFILRRLIQNKKVLIIGSGPSASDIEWIPENMVVMTCNAGLRFFTERKPDHSIDLYFCNKAKMEREKDISKLLQQLRVKVFISRNVDYVRSQPDLRGSFFTLLHDDSTDPYYLNRLIRPHRVQDIQGNCQATWTSTGIRLVQYALYFGAREIYLAGLDYGVDGYFWGPKPTPWGHPDIDENFIKVVSKKFPHLYSASPNSGMSRYLPYREMNNS